MVYPVNSVKRLFCISVCVFLFQPCGLTAGAEPSFDENMRRGERAYRQSHYNEARKLFLQASEQAESASDKIISLNSAGDCDFMSLRSRAALDCYQRSLAICDKDEELKKSALCCASLNNIAAALLEEKQVEGARSFLSRLSDTAPATLNGGTEKVPVAAWQLNQARVDLQPISLLKRKKISSDLPSEFAHPKSNPLVSFRRRVQQFQ